jgi:hypothetical protein
MEKTIVAGEYPRGSAPAKAPVPAEEIAKARKSETAKDCTGYQPLERSRPWKFDLEAAEHSP